MVTLTPGNSSFTAIAIICEALCLRITRPSSESINTGSILEPGPTGAERSCSILFTLTATTLSMPLIFRNLKASIPEAAPSLISRDILFLI